MVEVKGFSCLSVVVGAGGTHANKESVSRVGVVNVFAAMIKASVTAAAET